MPEGSATRLAGFATRVGPVMTATVASQLVAAAALAATPLLGLDVADNYALGIQIGNAAFAGVVMGVVYLLAIGRPWFDQWRTWSVVAGSFSVALPLIVAIIHYALAGPTHDPLRLPITLIFGVGGAALAAAGVSAVREACLGQPIPLAALTIVPNAALLLSVVATALAGNEDLSAAPALVWACACVLMRSLMRRPRKSAMPDRPRQPDDDDGRSIHTTALLTGVITSSVLPPLYISAVSQLRDGAATLLLLITRAGSSLVGLAVNSVLLVRYNWRTSSTVTGRLTTVLNLIALIMAIVAAGCHWSGLRLASYVLAVCWWILPLIGAPLVMRELNARRMGRLVLTKALIDLAVCTVVLIVLTERPTFTGYLAAFVVSQGITSAVCGVGLASRALTVTGVLVAISALTLLIVGW